MGEYDVDHAEIRVDMDGNIHVIAVDASRMDQFEIECVRSDDEWAPRE